MRKQTKLKKILLVFVLIGALLGVQVMEIAAYAAETDTGTVEPTVIVSTKEGLLNAIETSSNGGVIGIADVIQLDEDFLTVGDSKKKLTIVRTNDVAAFEITAEQVTMQNLIIDGGSLVSQSSMVTVDAMDKYVNFLNVTMQNCYANKNGGAVFVKNGTATFNMCRFQNNQGTAGGHISVWNNSVADIINCNLTTGTATRYGGAIEFSSSGRSNIGSSIIYNNSAPGGGGIYNDSFVSVNNSKIYGNHATIGGADIANTDDAVFQMMEGIDELVELFKSDDILPKAWVNDYNAESGDYIPGVTPSAPKSMMKLDYEEIVEEPVEPSEPSELTDPGDTEDPDDTGGDTTDPSEPSEGDDTDEPSTEEPDTGEDPTEPGTGDGDQDEPTDPSQPDDSDQGTEEPPSEPTTPPDDSDEPSTPTDPDDSQEPGDNITTDNSDHSSNDNSNTNIDNSSNDTTTTDKSDHSSIKTDNSVTNTNSGNTTNTTSDNSQRTEDNSSVTYNYYYPSAGDSEGQSQQPQQIVIHNYIQGNNEDQGVSSSQEEKVLYDPMKNVSIDAEGVDVVFEVVDGVYSISIKAREPEQQVQQAAEEPATESFMVDWYEVIKIALLGAIVFVVKKK